MNSKLIKTQENLKTFCKSIKRGDVIAVDLEFMRVRTFYPILCLIQINLNDELFAIDALAKDMNLKPFAKILKKRSVTKIIHSSSQDLEVLFQEFRFVPRSIVDTQLMANFLGFNYNTSYASLVKTFSNKELSKEQQRSNWQKRPLTKEQLEYALNDVKYLPKIYYSLKNQLEEEGKLKYFLKEMKNVLKNKTYDVNKYDIYKNFSFNNNNFLYQSNLITLIKWRDKKAKEVNIPRSFILKDVVLNEIAKRNPQNVKQVDKIFDEYNIKNRRAKFKIIFLLQNCKIVKKKKKILDRRLSEKQKIIYAKAQKLLLEKGEENNIRPEMIISQLELKNIILGHVRLKKLLSNWRYKLFGKYLKKIC